MFKLKNIFLIAFSLLAVEARAEIVGNPGLPLPATVEKRLNLSATAGPSVGLGSQVTQKKVNVMKAVYDFAVLGGASTVPAGGTTSVIALRDAAGGQAVLPKGAIITNVWFDTIRQFVGPYASVSFGINTETDLKAVTHRSLFSSITAGIPVGTAATAVKVASAGQAVGIKFTVGSVSDGKVNVFLEYLLSDTQ